MNIAYISNHPAPYRDSFLSLLVKAQGLKVAVFSMFPNDTGHAFWGLKKPDFEADVLAEFCETRWKLLWRLMKNFVLTTRYDLVVWPGIFGFYQKIPLLLCALIGKPYAFCADSVKQPPISKLGLFVKNYLIHRAEFIFVPGEAGVRFFANIFGVPRNKIVKGAYALDGVDLERKIAAARQRRNITRHGLGLENDDTIFLMVANMIKTRHYPITSSAFIRFAAKYPKMKFLMVGKGPETELMEKLAEEQRCLRVIPGCSFEEMLQLYAASDVYVHGGTEPASTALVIGAISKMPLISSPAVGCYYDVVRDGESGFSVADYMDEQQWYDAFERCLENRSRWCNMGANARELSKALDIDMAVANFIAAIRKTAE